MKLPLPVPKLVVLSLAGGLVAVAASVAVALPGFLPTGAPAQSPQAPQDNASFTPAYAPDPPRSHEWEDDEEDEWEERGEHDAHER